MRIVITGGPSVGKTTLISLLCELGYMVVQEQATEIIREGVFLPWVDRTAFQAEVLHRQLACESALPDNDEPVFLDRGLFDGEAYYIHDKLPVPQCYFDLDASKYTLALLIEELGTFDKNEIRRENIEFTRAITSILEECYQSHQVKVVRIPALSPQERVELVISIVRSAYGQLHCPSPPQRKKHHQTESRIAGATL
jgi:predicted ATPase